MLKMKKRGAAPIAPLPIAMPKKKKKRGVLLPVIGIVLSLLVLAATVPPFGQALGGGMITTGKWMQGIGATVRGAGNG